MLKKIKEIIGLYIFRKKWQRYNKHNSIIPMNRFPLNKVKVGKFSYGPIIVRTWNGENEYLKIGNFVSIAEGVRFILGGNHEINTLTTYPFKVMFFKEKIEAKTKGEISIEDDVWIGTNSIILSGVTVGQGAIIGAGSVVAKDVKPYSIVAGNPAKIIKYRYSQEIIDEMLKFDWSNIKNNEINQIKKELYEPLSLKLIKKIKKKIEEKQNDE